MALLDHQRLVTQLCSLERRTARGGKDSIDHGPHQHDDVINSAAGCLVLSARRAARTPFALINTDYDPLCPNEVQRRHDEEVEFKRQLGIDTIASAIARDGYYRP